MAALHPHQQVYFNALVDTNTPGALAMQYDMDYGNVTHRQLLEHLLAHYPDGALRVWPRYTSPALLLPSSDRERVVFTGVRSEADFHLYQRIAYMPNAPDPLILHNIQAYGSDIEQIIALPNSDAYISHYLAAYDDAAANGTLLARADFDIYIHEGKLNYLNADCAPPAANAKLVKIFLHLFPVNRADLPANSRERGFENRDFVIGVDPALFPHTGFFDGKCIAMQILPDYPIARIRTGQNAATSGGAEWRVDIDLIARAAAQAVYERIVSGDYGQPVAQSNFDLYLIGNTLAYLKSPCAPADTNARFFLHITPANPADLPAASRAVGFANMDFQFADHGAYIGDNCVAERELPPYPIDRIRTGQFVSGEGRLWGVEFPVAR